MGFEAARGVDTGEEGIHPGSAALVFAGKPIRVESSEEKVCFVADLVVLDVGVPTGDAGLFRNRYPVQPLDDFEHAGDDALGWEVGPKFLLIEFIEGVALL